MTLPTAQQANYTAVRRLEHILFNDEETMAQLIAEDVRIGDPINTRYLLAASDPSSELYKYRKIIMDSIPQSEHALIPTGELHATMTEET